MFASMLRAALLATVALAVFAAVLWVMVVRQIARDQQTAASMQPA